MWYGWLQLITHILAFSSTYLLNHTRYPPDKALFFKPLPKEIDFKSLSDERDDRDEYMDHLESSAQALNFLKFTGMDAINKYKDVAEGKMTAQQIKCDAFEAKAKALHYQHNVMEELCEQLCTVLPGMVGTNPACVPCRAKQHILLNAFQFADGLAYKCKRVVYTGLKRFLVANKLILWGVHWAIKVS